MSDFTQTSNWQIYDKNGEAYNPHPVDTRHGAWMAAERNSGISTDHMIYIGYRARKVDCE